VSISSATIHYVQETPPNVSLTGAKALWKQSGEEVHLAAEDKGTGISEFGIDATRDSIKEPSPGSNPAAGTSVHHPGCTAPFCPENEAASFNLHELGTGVWTIWPWAGDPAELIRLNEETIYVDKTPPVVVAPSWNGATYGGPMSPCSAGLVIQTRPNSV
jgi:hypothetical protein